MTTPSPHLERGRLLYTHGRYDLAERELRGALAEDVQSVEAHALLALCLLAGDRPSEALAAAGDASRAGPDEPLAHYARAAALLDLERIDQAEAAIGEALRLDPDDPDAHALLGAIHFVAKRWAPALASAEAALRLDATHTRAANVRALALDRLGQRAEAGAALEATLARDPEDPDTHANRGWTLLADGRREEALGHFREALRLRPGSERARRGVVEALKARSLLYRALLAYMLRMARLTSGQRWAVVLGAYVLYRFALGVVRRSPALAPYAFAVMVVYGILVLLTWIGAPLFDLLLRLDRDGRLALSDEERRTADLVGLALLVGAALGVASRLAPAAGVLRGALGGGAIGAVLLVLPIAATRAAARGSRRRLVLAAATGLLLAIGVAGLALSAMGSPRADPFVTAFVVGFVLFTWLANLVHA